MFGGNLTAIIALAGLLGTAGGYGLGRLHGSQAAEARHQEETLRTQRDIFEVGDRLSTMSQEIRRLLRENEALKNELEQMAFEAPGAGNPGVGPNGVQRTKRRWGTP